MPRRLCIVPLLLALPLMPGCLTTLAVSAAAGSGTGDEHIEAAKETARDIADRIRDKVDEIGLSAQDLLDSLRGSSD